jgi:multicomponent Na+:H+ antiporter subunit E
LQRLVESGMALAIGAGLVFAKEWRDMLARSVALAAALLVFWLALSGHYTAFLISAGVVSAVLIVVLTRTRQALDEETVPLEAILASVTYYPWLFVEIFKAAVGVAKEILRPELQISPVMTVVDTNLRTAIGVVTYGNSITLTPGTVTCGIKGKRLTVYAMVRAGALDIEAGGMEARVMQFEGGH